jgi:hypothetical protein
MILSVLLLLSRPLAWRSPALLPENGGRVTSSIILLHEGSLEPRHIRRVSSGERDPCDVRGVGRTSRAPRS